MRDKVAVLRRGKSVPPASAEDDARERRLHMRAHTYWTSLARKAECIDPDIGRVPLWRDFDPLRLDDRCTQSFLLDLAADMAPSLRLIGPALKAEGGVDVDNMDLVDAPPGSLLMRLSSLFPELVRRAVPLSVEAPFETADGRPGIYRGMLMPFTSTGRAIDTIFGVVSWRELIGFEMPAAPSVTTSILPFK